MQLFRKYPFAPAIFFLIATIILLTIPGSSIPKSGLFGIPYLDKCVHVGIFTLLCILFALPFKRMVISVAQKRNWFLTITGLGISFGIVMEFVQKYWAINRSFELGDIIADSIGCLLALIFSIYIIVPNETVS